LQNCLDNKSQQNYFRLNIILTKKQFTIDNINYIAKFRNYIYIRSNFKNNYIEIVYTIFLLLLFFELNYISLFVNKIYYCYNIIQYRLNRIYIFEVLNRLQQFY